MDMFTSGELKPMDEPPMAPQCREKAEGEEVKEEDNKVQQITQRDGKGVTSDYGRKEDEFDEFKDKSGLHYKPDMRATSKTPGLERAQNSFRQHSSIGDLHGRRQDMSKASLNFGGASNISSIVHLETVSAGYYSIDKQEYRLQKKKSEQRKKISSSRSSQALKDEPILDKGEKVLIKLNQESEKDLHNLGT